ncbi:MAG: alpha/beta hydrolase, partial [Gemmatimonadota bacterium]
WDELADYYIGRTDWVSSRSFPAGYHFSVLCAEDVSRVDAERIARVSAGTFMAGHLIRGYREACRVWPAAPLPDGFEEPVRSETPTLLLSGTRDPVTPAGFAEEVARHLPNSVHVVVPGGGHGVSGPCVRAMQVTLIETGSVDGLDTSCVGRVDAPAFRLPERTGGALRSHAHYPM